MSKNKEKLMSLLNVRFVINNSTGKISPFVRKTRLKDRNHLDVIKKARLKARSAYPLGLFYDYYVDLQSNKDYIIISAEGFVSTYGRYGTAIIPVAIFDVEKNALAKDLSAIVPNQIIGQIVKVGEQKNISIAKNGAWCNSFTPQTLVQFASDLEKYVKPAKNAEK